MATNRKQTAQGCRHWEEKTNGCMLQPKEWQGLKWHSPCRLFAPGVKECHLYKGKEVRNG